VKSCYKSSVVRSESEFVECGTAAAHNSHRPNPMRRFITILSCLLVIAFAYTNVFGASGTGTIAGTVFDPKGVAVAGATVRLVNAGGTTIRQATSDDKGSFQLQDVDPGEYQLTAESPGFVTLNSDISLASGEHTEITLQFQQISSVLQSITVVASAPSALTPDPAQSIILHDQVLDANPGRPGAPISLPGLPIETASGGIKAPQYFAPGGCGGPWRADRTILSSGQFPLPQ